MLNFSGPTTPAHRRPSAEWDGPVPVDLELNDRYSLPPYMVTDNTIEESVALKQKPLDLIVYSERISVMA